MRQTVLLLMFILATGFISYKIFGQLNLDKKEKALVMSKQTQVVLIASVSATPVETKKPPAFSKLNEIVNNSLSEDTNSYGIAVKNLKTRESFYFEEHKKFDAGSIYKLWIMTTVYEQIKEGLLDEDQVLTQKISVLNNKFNISYDAAERTSGTISLSVFDAVYQMITYSDNYAALLLSEKVRLSSVADYLNTHGFTESKVGTDGSTPTTTALDTLLFFEKLYTGTLADEKYTEKMIGILKEQKLNNKIPKYLPAETVVAHKTGEIYGFSHDAGIVYTPFGNYIISVFSESKIPAQAEEKIAYLSRAINDYFTK